MIQSITGENLFQVGIQKKKIYSFWKYPSRFDFATLSLKDKHIGYIIHCICCNYKNKTDLPFNIIESNTVISSLGLLNLLNPAHLVIKKYIIKHQQERSSSKANLKKRQKFCKSSIIFIAMCEYLFSLAVL